MTKRKRFLVGQNDRATSVVVDVEAMSVSARVQYHTTSSQRHPSVKVILFASRSSSANAMSAAISTSPQTLLQTVQSDKETRDAECLRRWNALVL